VPVIIVGAIARDRGQPGSEAVEFAQSVQTRQRAQKYILDQVVDFAERNPREQNAVHEAGVAVVQVPEGHTIARACGSYQWRVVELIHGRPGAQNLTVQGRSKSSKPVSPG